ncbi:MAG TPA: acyl-CoA dehydrogenase family protein, partial [Acidimicrobiales bacterium]|nr:acyl-CoA dehydrogenase family protein [Acidimicrobiales bacterium]
DRRHYERSVRAVMAWHGALAGAGFPVPDCPAAYGGRDRTLGMGLVQAEEMARAGATFSVNIVGISMVAPLLVALGTPEQRARWLPGIVAGRDLWCQLFSEPDAGSDLFALRAVGVPEDGHLRIRGQKIWSSTADLADLGVMLVRTDPDAPGSSGISCCVVDMRSPGITVRPIREMTGCTSFCEVFFDDVVVPGENLVGALHSGARAALTVLAAERTGLTIGNYAHLISRFECLAATGEAGAARRLDVVRLWEGLALLRLGALRGVSAGRSEEALGLAAAGKLALGRRVVDFAFLHADLLGARAAAFDPGDDEAAHAVEYANRALAYAIGGGTHEMQRNAIAERLLGLPR